MELIIKNYLFRVKFHNSGIIMPIFTLYTPNSAYSSGTAPALR